MANQPKVLLINPPLWNAYAPHLAIPLLTGVLKERGWEVKGIDLSIESLDWLISRTGLSQLEQRLEQRAQNATKEVRKEIERAQIIFPSTLKEIDNAKSVLRSFSGLRDHETFMEAKIVLRNALRCISASFTNLNFDLFANNLYYSARSTKSVLQASQDPELNIYRWLLEQLLPKYISDPGIGLVGISVSADTQLIAAVTIAKLIRELRPDIHITMGGNFTTRIVRNWREANPISHLFDTFILYEGEDSLHLLCESLFNGGVDQIPGLVEQQGMELVHTPPKDVNLDENPAPNFDHIPLDKYFAPGPVIPTYASRSCAWSCAFCSIPFASNRFRMRKANQIADEMEYLARRYGSRHFMFVDEIMTVPSMRNLSDELIQRNSKFFWYGETRFNPSINQDLADRLYQSGCRRMNFGLESFNQRVLNLMNKETDVEFIPKNIESFLKAGVAVHLFTILGFPGETKEETLKTIYFAEEIMRRSAEEFNVPYSTWGASPFILDLNSPIGKQPDMFGVEIIPPSPDEDIALSANYRIKHGMSEEESLELFEATSRRSPYRPQENINWFHQSSVRDVEEEVFLRACYNTGLPKPLNRKLFAPSQEGGNVFVWLSDDVTVYRSQLSLFNASVEEKIVLYKFTKDYVVELPIEAETLIKDLTHPVAIEECVERLARICRYSNNQVSKTIEMLVRLNFFETNMNFVTLDEVEYQSLIFYQEPEVYEEFQEDEKIALLINRITGKVVEMNLEGYAIWSLCPQGSSVNDPMLKSMGLPDIPDEEIQNFFRNLCEYGFLYAKLNKDFNSDPIRKKKLPSINFYRN